MAPGATDVEINEAVDHLCVLLERAEGLDEGDLKIILQRVKFAGESRMSRIEEERHDRQDR